MKMKVIIIILALVSLLLSSCIVTSQFINVDISCEEFQENPNSIILNDFEIEIGDKITVNLCSNPTTGFQWNYVMSGDNAVKEEDHDFEEPEQDDVVGAPGIEVWTFEGTAKGTTVVLMEYSQPWEGGIKKEWTYRMTITVQ